MNWNFSNKFNVQIIVEMTILLLFDFQVIEISQNRYGIWKFLFSIETWANYSTTELLND